MQSLPAIRPRFVHLLNRPWEKTASFTSVRAFSSSSSDEANQSRGGLPRFFSQVLPSSKANSPSLSVSFGGVVRVEGDEFWHMTKVLRLNANDRMEGEASGNESKGSSFAQVGNGVELFNGKGGLIEGCIQRINRSGLDIVALEDPKLVLPHYTQWHVVAAFGTLKGGRADWLIEKCTELGAHSVTPLLTERSPSISENRVDRLQRVILAASKQLLMATYIIGQRLHEMILNPPTKIDGLLPIVAQSKLSFVAIAEGTPLVSALTSSSKESSGLIIVGPEGDFTEKEVNMIMEAGAIAVGLGPHRLRVETATIALLATLMLWSDSQQMPNS
ncbi:hypothetical protein JRO89_XS02G0108000 [Xanthoceras sorbifolium]|uniref:16S rRNA (uracil(1498)-N(3))-methyltransferase n=1 Tax=Xanthoceras sorbifolium TaxID=99658 RepID=A0ABQ8IFT7_9ROSI|nr:hypothetical protein JRO89_XS02G0108000 [Xanthoceras sorbifolium]